MGLELQPITQREASRWIEEHHRTHTPPRGWKFGIAVNDGDKVVGVITIGRPVSHNLDDGWTAEITRCCTNGFPNAASMLYGAAARASRAMGYRRVITYTLKRERGTSLRAAGWTYLYSTSGGSWNRIGRPRVDINPTEQKSLWEAP